MTPVIIRPDFKYWIKLFVRALPAAPVLFILLPLSLPFREFVGMVICVPVILYLLIAFLSATLYYNSLRYEILEGEVIVHSGVLTKTVKHVPFRTITNLQITRGPLDRMIGLGTLDIQTAGASGTASPEESLVGLGNVQRVYEMIAYELRRFQGGMSPIQTGSEANRVRNPQIVYEQQLLEAILVELRAIRSELNR